MVVRRGCGGSRGLWWFEGVVVVRRGCSGSRGLWWFEGVLVVQGGCGGLRGLWWFEGVVMVHTIGFKNKLLKIPSEDYHYKQANKFYKKIFLLSR